MVRVLSHRQYLVSTSDQMHREEFAVSGMHAECVELACESALQELGNGPVR